MVLKFTIVTADVVNPADYPLGIVKDTHIDEGSPTNNFGNYLNFYIGEISQGAAGGRFARHVVLEIQMPEKKDIAGLDDIIKVELIFTFKDDDWTDATFMVVGIVEIPDNFDEGAAAGPPDWCNWTQYIDSVAWTRGDGACKSKHGISDEDGEVFDTVRISSTGGAAPLTLDLTEALSTGDKKRFAIFVIDNDVSAAVGQNDRALVRYYTKEYTTASDRPILRVTYRSYPPDGFTEGDDKLKIEPNPDYPIQPKLTWGAVKVNDFLQYKLYRSTTPITTVDGFKSAITDVSIASEWFKISGNHTAAFPVGSTFKVTGSTGNDDKWTVSASVYSGGKTQITVTGNITNAVADGDIHHGIWTSTDSAIVEFIDTFSSAAGTRYYYRLIAEDQDNHEDNALLSATVSWAVPNVTTRSIAPSGAQNVGVEVTLTVTSDRLIKRLNVDWMDGSQAWYEYETTALTQTVKHRYSKHSSAGPWNPVSTVEDDLGFWSYGYLTSNSITISDLAPEAKLLVNVKKAIEGDEVTLNGSLSQPQASNATFNRYRFKRYAADGWQDNGTNPVYTFSTVGFGTGTITASLEVRTNVASGQKTDTDTVTYDLESGTPTEITPGVIGGLSIQTAIHELPHRLTTDKSVGVPIGSAGVEHEYELARRAERLTIHATTEYPSMEDDIAIIRNAWLNNTYLRLTVKTEMETKDVQYDFKLDGDVSLGHITDNKITWSFPIRVITRTEVAKPKVKGDITVWANPGGGKVTATSIGHGLSVGHTVLITGTINYNGTYVITNVTANTFRFFHSWDGNDAMGLWRKVGVS